MDFKKVRATEEELYCDLCQEMNSYIVCSQLVKPCPIASIMVRRGPHEELIEAGAKLIEKGGK